MSLRNRSNIEQARKQAKDLLRAFRGRQAGAIERFASAIPQLNSGELTHAAKISLHDAQKVVAHEHGFASWAALLDACSQFHLNPLDIGMSGFRPIGAGVEALERDGVMRLRKAVPQEEIVQKRDHLWREMGTRLGFQREDAGTWMPAAKGDLVPWNGAWRPGHKVNKALSKILKRTALRGLAHSLDGILEQTLRPQSWIVFPYEEITPALNFPMPEQYWTVPHISWHLDIPGWAAETPSWMLYAFVFLDHVRAGGGGMVLLAGSHRHARKLAYANGRTQESLLLAYASHIRSAKNRGLPVDLEILPQPSSTGVLTSKEYKRAAGIRNSWMKDLMQKIGNPDERVRRFMTEEIETDGIPLRVVELTGEPGDVVLWDPRCLHALAPNVADRPRFMLRLTCLQTSGA